MYGFVTLNLRLEGFSGDCFYSKLQCLVLDSDQLVGVQAQYVRIPLSDSTTVKAPTSLRATSLFHSRKFHASL